MSPIDSESDPVVLAVDDDEEILETYRLWLFDVADVRTAVDGETALDTLRDDVDVILLDRMMPGLSGREVLERVRETDGEYLVVVATAVDPGYDVVDSDCDAYLPKPMSRERLVETVDRVRRRDEYPSQVQEYLRLRSLKRTLEAVKDHGTLGQRDEYRRLCERIDALEAECRDDLDDVDALG
ncbi:response regulator [Halospeciosus flavus]|uniref:Response regulator n=1 Tax=Halospeciosus flavus TaxID=3032283 RepID=A0ABD5Z5U5_9EURY|nr:response regulator [Halospeciosus flavus]